MRQARRRQYDPWATPEGVRKLLHQLRQAAPGLIPGDEKRLISLLNAIRYLEKSPPTKSSRGRPSQWSAAELSEVSTLLRELLSRETGGRVSLQTFIGQHLPLLTYPAEIANALQRGEINKQEAGSLGRITADRLQTTELEAMEVRRSLLKAHLAALGSQNQLRERVKEILGETGFFSRETLNLGIQKTDSLLEFNRQDVKHVFFETMRDLFYAIRTINPEDVQEEDIAEFMTAADVLTNTLRKIEQRVALRKPKDAGALKMNFQPETDQQIEIITDPQSGQVTYKFH